MSLLRLSPPFKFPLHFSGSRGWLCPGGRRSRWCFPGAVAPHLEVGGQSPHTIIWPAHGQAQSQRAGKYESFKHTNRRPAPSDGSATLPINASAITGEKPAACSWQLVPPEGGVMYGTLLAGTVAPVLRRVWGLPPLQCVASQAPEHVRKNAVTRHPAAPKAQWDGLSAE